MDKITLISFPRSILFFFLLATFCHATPSPSWNVREWTGREGLPGEVTALDQGPDGMLWIGTSNGAASFDGERFETVGVREGLPDPEVTALTACADGRVWIGTLEGGLAEWHCGRMRLHNDGLPSGHVTALLEHDGRLWVGTSRGLVHRDNNSFTSEISPFPDGISVVALRRAGDAVAVDLADGTSWSHLAGDWVLAAPASPTFGPELAHASVILQGREGTVWAGIRGRGLIRMVPSAQKHLPLPEPGATKVTCIVETVGGELWAATDRGGLFRWIGPEDEAAEPIETVGGGPVHTLLETSDGGLWAGKDDWLIHWQRPGDEPSAYSMGSGIRALRNYRGGMLAGLSDGRIVRVRTASEAAGPIFTTLSQDPERREVRALATAPDDSIWAGFFGRLVVIDRDGHERALDFPKAAVSSILPGLDGTAWVGTRGHGLIRIDSFAKASSTCLPADSVAGIARDQEGNLWLACRPGLIRLDSEQERSMAGEASDRVPVPVLTSADGLPEEDCTGAIVALKDGRMAIGSGHTVTIVSDSAFAHVDHFDPTPRVDRVEVDDRVRDFDEHPLNIPAESRRLTVRFTAPTPEVSEKVRFRYRLLPLEPDWQLADGDRIATYSALPPGNYVFQLSCGLAGHKWNDTITGFPIRMAPRFWQTGWWRLLSATALLVMTVSGAVWLSRRRTRALALRLRRDRELEAERARIAADLHDTLGAGLTQIGLFIELARASPEATNKKHLARAFQLARQSARSLDEIVWAVNPLNDSLDRSLTYLGRVSEELLAAAGIDCQLNLPMDADERILSGSRRHHLYLALREALNNVIRHADASTVRIDANIESDDILRLRIQDDGRGFHSESVRPESNGLAGLRRRMATTGGSAIIISQPGRGTTIELAMPRRADDGF